MKKFQFHNRKYNSLSLSSKLRYIIISLTIPLVICIVLVMSILVWYTKKYSILTYNVKVSSKFNLDFKKSLDLKMYYYTVGSKEQKELPIADVDDAIQIAEDLQDTTQRKESKKAIKNVLDYCEKLKKRMYIMDETESYDSRYHQLDSDIYVLTNLIQQSMMDYIYYEAGYLSSIEQQMVRDILIIVVCIGIMIFGVVALILRRSFIFSEGIVRPISKLCDNVNEVGRGNFEVESVQTNAFEIAHLDEGIRNMAKRIELLLESVKQEEHLQHKIHLQLLQAQVNPHFLYNTLDTIVWMVEAGMHDDAIEMLNNLSIFFRTALSKGEDIITLREEIRHTRSYLEIQQARYRDIMEYQIELPDSMGEIMIPKLTLQPLVENALYHGIREKRGQSKITISFEDVGHDIVIFVIDNGIGITEQRLSEIHKSMDEKDRIGFGISAVQSRLKLYFGEPYGMQITSSYGDGTNVKITLPKIMN